MKIIAISNKHNASTILSDALSKGYLPFIYHHADPKHKLLRDKFLYVHDDTELLEKMKLVRSDMTIRYAINL